MVQSIDDLFQRTDEIVSKRTSKMGLVAPSGKKLTYLFEGEILYRPLHDQHLVKMAKSSGAEYVTKANSIKDKNLFLSIFVLYISS